MGIQEKKIGKNITWGDCRIKKGRAAEPDKELSKPVTEGNV